MAARKRKANEWQLQEAKARFSELFRLAHEKGPQRVTRHGTDAVVVIPAEEYDRLCKRRGGRKKESLVEFLRRSPLVGSGIDLSRPRDYGRDVDL